MKSRANFGFDEHLFKFVVVMALVLFGIALYLYSSEFNAGLSNKQDVWGQFGDFLGGTLNPILGFLTVLILISTLKVQRVELKQARKSLKKNAKLIDSQVSLMKQQALESTFFKLLEDFNSDPIVNKCKSLDQVRRVYLATYLMRDMDLASDEAALKFSEVMDDLTLGEFGYVVAEKLMVMTEIATKLKNGNIHLKILQTSAGIALVSSIVHQCKISDDNYHIFKNATYILRGINHFYIFDDEVARDFMCGDAYQEYLDNKEVMTGHIERAIKEISDEREKEAANTE